MNNEHVAKIFLSTEYSKSESGYLEAARPNYSRYLEAARPK
jgi:hypothetical protein